MIYSSISEKRGEEGRGSALFSCEAEHNDFFYSVILKDFRTRIDGGTGGEDIINEKDLLWRGGIGRFQLEGVAHV